MPNDYFWSTFLHQNYVCIVRLPYYLWNSSVIQPADSTPLHVTSIKELQNNGNSNDEDNNNDDDDDDDELFGTKAWRFSTSNNKVKWWTLSGASYITSHPHNQLPKIAWSYSPLHVYLNGNFWDFLMKSLYTLLIPPIWTHVLPIITSKISLLLIILSYMYK